MSGYDREAAEAEAREAAERDRLPSEYTSQVLRATAFRMQSRIDAILERDKDERVAIEGRGAGISFLFARDIVHALTAGHDEIDRLQAELASLRAPATDEALVEVALTALIGEDDGEEDVIHQITGKRSTIRKRVRRQLAAIQPGIAARERERCAKIIESGMEYDGSDLPTTIERLTFTPAWSRNQSRTKLAAAIRKGTPNAAR